MREKRDAPVDSMGCHKTFDEGASPQIKAFQTLVGVLLSVQTTDPITFDVMKKITKAGLSVEWAIETQLEEIRQIIKSVNFNRKKAENLKKVAAIIQEKHAGLVPDQYDQLVKLPGIGPKIAHVFLRVAYGQNTGIGVDVHVHRIVNRLNWVDSKQPPETELALQQLFDKSDWNKLNLLLVGFGQQICKKAKPSCKICLLNPTCRYAYKEMF